MNSTGKIILFFVVWLSATLSCHTQNREEMDARVNELLGNLYKEVKYLDKAINYHMQITIGGCAFQVLVNDLEVWSDPCTDASGSFSMNTGINNNILESGIQTWEVRVFPPYDRELNLTTLPEEVSIMVRVNAIRFGEDGVEELVEPFYLLTTPQVEKEGEMVYADAGKPMMVYKGTFEAKVPYTLTGWSRSIDLREMDRDKLEAMLVQEYKLLARNIERGELDKIAKKIHKMKQDYAQSLFFTDDDNQSYLASFYEIYGRADFTVCPIENYKMTFWGDGRMVTLERTDYLFNPALITEYPIERRGKTEMMDISYRLFFHIPEGSDQLEIIR